jgi:hypothetical protein
MPSFTELETGRESRPADLYRFDFGSEVFRFTNIEDDITFGGALYTAIPIKRGSPLLNPRENNSERIRIEAPSDRRPFSDFTNIQPALKLEASIIRIQLDETLLGSVSPQWSSPQPAIEPNTGFIIFEGYVTSIAFQGRTCTVEMNPNTEQFNREIPRYKYQSLCNHVLYDSQCQVNPNLFRQTGVVNGIDGNNISVGGFTGSAFTAGYCQNAGGTDYRMILEHSADVFTLLLPFSSDILGQTITAFQGCAHDVVTCKDKFNNVPNFGGFPFVPTANPFQQNAFAKIDKKSMPSLEDVKKTFNI